MTFTEGNEDFTFEFGFFFSPSHCKGTKKKYKSCEEAGRKKSARTIERMSPPHRCRPVLISNENPLSRFLLFADIPLACQENIYVYYILRLFSRLAHLHYTTNSFEYISGEFKIERDFPNDVQQNRKPPEQIECKTMSPLC